MSVTCQSIIKAVEALAPRQLAEDWDNVGLLLGSPAQPIEKVMITLDVTPAVVEYAKQHRIDLIVSHHPLIFQRLAHIRADVPQEALIHQLIHQNIAVYAAHTNFDVTVGGVNDVLAEKFHLQAVCPLTASTESPLVKLVVFVPPDYVETVRTALAAAGAGHIGNYSDCCYYDTGTGVFKPLPGTHPFVGEQGQLERVPEYRLETILPAALSQQVLQAMMAAHPYEEVAYDLYPLQNQGNAAAGAGRIGKLPAAVPFSQFVAQVKAGLGVAQLQVAADDEEKMIVRVAVCGGSGAGLIREAATAGADVLITGDVKYHEAQAALYSGLYIINAGHFATESPAMAALADYLQQYAAHRQWELDIHRDIGQDIFTIV